MTHGQLVRCNQILGDRLGRIPAGYPCSGESAWQFKRSADLYFPMKSSAEAVEQTSGLVLIQPVHRMERQLPGEDCWVIARWVPPGWAPPDPQGGSFEDMGEDRCLSPAEYERLYNGNFGWNANGSWICVTPLRPGKDPDETWTEWAADNLLTQRNLSLRETFYLLAQRQEQLREEYREGIRLTLRDLWTNHVPGARGGSYSAFSEPS